MLVKENALSGCNTEGAKGLPLAGGDKSTTFDLFASLEIDRLIVLSEELDGRIAWLEATLLYACDRAANRRSQ